MQGASDEFVKHAAKDVGPLHSRVAKMQGKLAKSELRRREQGVAEGDSNAMADTAKRLSNKDDGKVAKLRAAGDKRREDQLKGKGIAKRDQSEKDEWGNYKRESIEEARQSAQVRLAKAWDKQKAKSAASRERAKELLNPSKQEPKKDSKTQEDAAGVGIITKQNTTKDVNKGTLRKMMKGYKLI
jgi:hypothetical protein